MTCACWSRVLNTTEIEIFKTAVASVLGLGITTDMISMTQVTATSGRRLLQVLAALLASHLVHGAWFASRLLILNNLLTNLQENAAMLSTPDR